MLALKQRKKSPKELALLANTIRKDIISMLTTAQSGHTAGSLGMAEVFTTLYFRELKHNPKKPLDPNRDFVFLSNGHICPVLYTTLAHAGYFPRAELSTLRKLGSRLQGHPHVGSLPGVENSGGPLGQGTSQSCGVALGLLREKKNNHVYCFTGDGELNEGQCWEAAMFAAHYKLGNLTWIVDKNNIQIDGNTQEIMNTEDLGEKFAAFGWHVIRVSGHDIEELLESFKRAKNVKQKPTVLLAYTVPGRGVEAWENDYHWHGKAPKIEQAQKAYVQLKKQRDKIEGKK